MLGGVGIFFIIFWISLHLWNSVFADIDFDNQDSTIWYDNTVPNAYISAIQPPPPPVPVIVIQQTRHSH